jgi:hypothetical protein
VVQSLERRTIHAEREIRGFAIRLVKEGDWTSAGKPHDRSLAVIMS